MSKRSVEIYNLPPLDHAEVIAKLEEQVVELKISKEKLIDVIRDLQARISDLEVYNRTHQNLI